MPTTVCSNYRPFSGSKVDHFLRHGFHPTKVGYPNIVVRKRGRTTNTTNTTTDEIEDFPVIDLNAILASQPFVDSFTWSYGDGECKALAWNDTYTSSTSRSLRGATAMDIFQNFGRLYGGGWLVIDSNVDEILSLSTPIWNDNYYENVLRQFEKNNSSRNAFWNYEISTSKSGISHVHKDHCVTLSFNFLDAYESLPAVVQNDDFSAYLDFCETFGWYYPTGYTIGTQRFSVNDGNQTDYLFGQFGDHGDASCSDPSPDSFELSGWDQLLDPLSPVADNFKKFYDIYPVASEPSPSLKQLLEEELFTYEPPKFPSFSKATVSSQEEPTSYESPQIDSTASAKEQITDIAYVDETPPNAEESYEPPQIADAAVADETPPNVEESYESPQTADAAFAGESQLMTDFSSAHETSSTVEEHPLAQLDEPEESNATMFLSSYVLIVGLLGVWSIRQHWSNQRLRRKKRRMH